MHQEVTQAFILSRYSYDAHSGAIISVRTGRVLNVKQFGKQYLQMRILGKSYRTHRVIWMLVHGSWPRGQVDHINGIKDDNRLCNLRDVSININNQNKRLPFANSHTGVLGVGMLNGKYRARIRVNGKRKHLGDFETIEDASNAYVNAKRLLHAGNTL